MEQSLVIIKPDGVQRHLIGRIISRFEGKGLKLAALKLTRIIPRQARVLYAMHKKKQFYKRLIKFTISAPVVAMVIEANEVVSICRKLAGTTFGPDAEPGTIRGDFGASLTYTLVHVSDSPETAQSEIPMFFKESEIIDYKLYSHYWIYSSDEERTP